MDWKTVTTQTYNRSAKQFAEVFASIGSRVQDIDLAFSQLSKKDPKVLEIGCGDGRDALEIMRRTKDYTGIDISEEMLRLAREKVPGGIFELADVESYAFPENTDIIFAFASLLHLPEDSVRQVIVKAKHSLRQNGILFVSLKYGEYCGRVLSDEFGERVFYFYKPEMLIGMAGPEFQCIYSWTHHVRSTLWFEVMFSKK